MHNQSLPTEYLQANSSFSKSIPSYLDVQPYLLYTV